MPDTATLLLSCPDRPGLVARTSAFLADREANIVHADQHTDHEVGLFLQRIEFELDGLDGHGTPRSHSNMRAHLTVRHDRSRGTRATTN